MNRAEKRRQQKLAEKAAKKNHVQPAGLSIDPQSLEIAVQHHSAGRLSEAENLYQKILKSDPNHPTALHLLGLIAHQVGKNGVAVDLMTKALSIKPDYVEAHGNLGNAYSRLGKLAEAVASYRKALAIKPDYADAHGNLAAALQGLGKLDEALIHYHKALAIRPEYSEAHSNLGTAFRELGKLDEAVTSFQKAASLNPNYANAHNGLGLALQEMGKHEEAADCYQQAIAIKPDFAEAHCNLGATLQKLGKLDEAVASCRKALSINSSFAEAHNNLGIAFKEQGEFEAALSSFKMALATTPNYCEALNNLGSTLHNMGRFDEAVVSYNKALSINPDYASAYSNLGATLHGQGKLNEAVSNCQKALALKPDFADAHNNLGNALKDLGRTNGAISSYQKAVSIRPDNAEAYSNMGTAFQELGELEEALSSCSKAISINPDFAMAHSNLIFIQDLYPDIEQSEQQAERKRWNDKFILPLAGQIRAHTNNRDPDRRLRIGYVSADFCHHSARLGFGPLIMDHDRNNFEVFCYDASIVHDDVSDALRAAATDWRYIVSMSDEQLAQTIRDDAIDILIDLSGHTRGNRLKVFGLKPAPLQATGIGHMAPGLTTLDYRLTTDRLTPPEKEKYHPESPIYLETFFGFTPPSNSPPVGPLPCRKNGTITFGYLGRVSRVSDEALALWARILRDLSGSRLVLKYSQLDDQTAQQNIKERFSALGITEDRLTLLGKTDQPEHLDAHNHVDLVFDTFPHGGGMTTMDSLWMGIPVIGLLNPERASGRISDCICHPVTLDEWIARSPEEYYAIAIRWAKRVNELADIRQGLRQRLTDVYFRFPHDVEKSYRHIWRRWCVGEASSPLYPHSLNDPETEPVTL